MRFKVGDVVIKSTGGNRMTVHNPNEDSCECIWITDKVYQEKFLEEDLLLIEEYKRLEERNDKISELLK